MKKAVFSKIAALLLCIVTLFGTSAVSVSAATWGTTGSATIYVTTVSNYWYPGSSSITLKQDKQTLTYKKLWGKGTKSKTGYYGCYNVTVYNVTKKKTTNVYWGGGQTKKISLDRNCTYRITVTYNSLHTGLFTRAPLGYSLEKTSNPFWRVGSYWKVASFY